MKILIIGQAPPYQKQELPYDSTMLYTWLNELGVSKEAAQSMFEFEAMFDSFTGFDSKGGHLKPSKEQMEDYWNRSLEKKFLFSDKIWILGNVAKEFILATDAYKNSKNKIIIFTIHPSKRNFTQYNNQKDFIINNIKKLLK